MIPSPTLEPQASLRIHVTDSSSIASWYHPNFGHLVATGDGSLDRAIGQLTSIRNQYLAITQMVLTVCDWEASGLISEAESDQAVSALASDLKDGIQRIKKGLQLLPSVDGQGFELKESADGWVAVFRHPELGVLESNCHSNASSLVQEAILIGHRLAVLDRKFAALDYLLDEEFITEDEFEADHELLFIEVQELCAQWS